MNTLTMCGQNRTLVTPLTIQTGSHDAQRQSALSRPLSNTQGGITHGHKTIKTSILSLLSCCSPAKIANLIMTIYINAVKRQFGRGALSDMCKKFFKRIKAKLYASSSIAVPPFVLWGFAPFTSFTKSTIFGGFALSVSTIRNGCSFILQATTRMGIATFQIATIYASYVATLTFTPPISMVFHDARKTKNSQTTKYVVSQINKFASRWKRFKNNVIFSVGHNISLIQNIVITPVQSLISARAIFMLPQETV